MIEGKILTVREKEIIKRKLEGYSLTQNESNILSKSVRPKLREISKVNASILLNKLEYNQKAKSIENNIKKLILENMADIQALLIYGSAIQSNYRNYNDVDVLIITKKKTWNVLGDKYDLIIKLTEMARKIGLNLDIQIIDKEKLYQEYPHSPSLIYQLEDCKIIYGGLNLPSETKISKLDLRMKLDWSDMDDEDSKSNEIYQALRNIILVRLLLNKVVNNESLRLEVNKELGEKIIARLKSNTASKLERKLALQHIKDLSEKTDKEILGAKWEKIVL